MDMAESYNYVKSYSYAIVLYVQPSMREKETSFCTAICSVRLAFSR
jgi:hypothetical protein